MVQVHVWGDYACFTRPELKVERTSYPVMTPSAARGMLESIYYKPQMAYVVQSIRVLRRGSWFNCMRNEITRSPTVDNANPVVAGGGARDGTQRGMLALAGVSYIITAHIVAEDHRKHVNIFTTRVARGQCFHTPYFGCKEFAAFFGPVNGPVAGDCDSWSEELGYMLYDVFDPYDRLANLGVAQPPRPCLFPAVVRNGVMDCHHERVGLLRGPRYEAIAC